MAKVEICAKEKENKLWKTSICPEDRKLRQAHNDDPTMKSTAMSCDKQKRKAKEEVDERDVEDSRLLEIWERAENFNDLENASEK